MKQTTLIIFGWLVLSLTAQAAGFDCAKAGTKVEKLICGDAALSKLDEELNTAYKTALQDEKRADSIRQAQKKWMKERSGCQDAGCVKRVYRMRLVELNSSDGKGAKHEATQVFQAKEPADAFCAEIKRMMHTEVSEIKGAHQTVNIYELDKYYLDGEGTSIKIYHDLDIDGDGTSDLVESGCSASMTQPSDPCLLSVKLSSGKQFDFEGWDIRLMKYRSKIYVISHHDDEARDKLFTESPNRDEGVIYHPEVAATIKYELYQLNSSGTTLICKKL